MPLDSHTAGVDVTFETFSLRLCSHGFLALIPLVLNQFGGFNNACHTYLTFN